MVRNMEEKRSAREAWSVLMTEPIMQRKPLLSRRWHYGLGVGLVALKRVWAQTGDARYKKAAFLLREQLQARPRTSSSGLWHKKIYPHQMWLDGIYMASPFCAEFARRFDEPGGFDDVAHHRIIVVEEHARDPKTALLYHAWDESRSHKEVAPFVMASVEVEGVTER